jgi:Xaa-Pro aminopeptidase
MTARYSFGSHGVQPGPLLMTKALDIFRGTIEEMEDPKARMTMSLSQGEMERRWKAVREVMRERQVDFLVMRNDEEFLGGYVRWFTDFPPASSYALTVIFPSSDEMTMINSGGAPPAESPYPPAWAVHGVKQRLSAPYFASMHYTSTMDAELAVGVLKERPGATIGLVGLSFIPMTFYEHLCKHLPGCQFIDMTDPIDQLKAIKSPEEIALIRQTAKIQDRVMEHLRQVIKPGMRDFEVLAEAQYASIKQGSERQFFLVGSGPQEGIPTRWQFRRFQNRVIREGDQISILVEVNGPGGYYTEIGRVFSMGKPSQALQDAFGTAVEAQALNQNMMKPGTSPKELWDANNAFLQKRGYNKELRLYAHGQGIDAVERPAIRYDEPMRIQPGMNITIHPFAVNKAVWAAVTDNYLITERGECVWIHTFPKEIIVV